MELPVAIHLIKNKHLIQPHPTTWADLGCGAGLFTCALAAHLAPGSKIYAVDRVPVRLDPTLPHPGVKIETRQLDFIAEDLPWGHLDGLLMANSLHYVQEKPALIDRLSTHLQPDGRFLIVEYDTDTPVPQWVPYPVSFVSLKTLFEKNGYASVQYLGERPSVFGRANMYAALITT